MTKYIKGKDGKFAGSIGDGKSSAPTSIPTPVSAPTESAPEVSVEDTLKSSLGIWLRTRIYPPVPTTMVDPCAEAIKNCADGQPDALVKLPEGVSWRGETSAPSRAIVEGHRLEDHVDTWASLGEELVEGECDVCGESYDLGDSEDHCPECGTCWEHCTYGTKHYHEVS